LDSFNFESVTDNLSYAGFEYFYDIFHVKVVTIKGDTIILAKVFCLLTEIKEYRNSFGLKAGINYEFFVGGFSPCYSDFPRMKGCGNSEDSLSVNSLRNCVKKIPRFSPQNSKISEDYFFINRIIAFAEIDKNIDLKRFNR
jgi:hypothetical protein